MKKVTWLALGLLVVAQNGFAFPGLTLLQKQLNNGVGKGIARTKPSHCTDFSGTWKGKCGTDDIAEDSSFTIAQTGCELLSMGSEPQVLGGLQTLGQVIPQASGEQTITYGLAHGIDWNENNTEIVGNFAGLVKILGNREIVPVNGKSVMKLDGSSLVIDMELIGLKVACVYQKQ